MVRSKHRDPARSPCQSLRRIALVGCALAAVGLIAVGLYRHLRDGRQPAASSEESIGDRAVNNFVLSADGTRIYCRSVAKQVDVRDAVSGKSVGSLNYHGQHPLAISHAARKNVLLAVYLDRHSGEGSLVLWTVSPAKNQYRTKLVTRDRTLVSCAISPDGSIAVCGHSNGAVTLWRLASNTRLRGITMHSGYVDTVCFSANGLRYLSADKSKCIVWDAKTGQTVAQFAGPNGRFFLAALSPGGERIVSASLYESTLRLWDVTTKSLRWQADLQSDRVRAVAFSPDAKVVAAGTDSGKVSFRDAESGRCVGRLSVASGWITCLALSRDGRRLYTSSTDGGIQSWDVSFSRAEKPAANRQEKEDEKEGRSSARSSFSTSSISTPARSDAASRVPPGEKRGGEKGRKGDAALFPLQRVLTLRVGFVRPQMPPMARMFQRIDRSHPWQPCHPWSALPGGQRGSFCSTASRQIPS